MPRDAQRPAPKGPWPVCPGLSGVPVGITVSVSLSDRSSCCVAALVTTPTPYTQPHRHAACVLVIPSCHLSDPVHVKPFQTIYVHGVLTVRTLERFAFPLPVDHIVSELSLMTCPSWVALQGVAHSFIELRKPLHHSKAVIHWRDPWRSRVIGQGLDARKY